MGSFANFENFASMAMGEGKNGVNYPLTRQGSIYSMTFDELQTMGSLGRDIGSLNMEELLKNLWTAEEIQANSTVGGSSCNAPCPSGNLQRQGSLTLPRTISQKTVDDVWKELLKENGGGSKDESDNRFSNMFQREPTLGEITLEEFLARAGVVREEIQPFEKPSSACSGFSQANKPIEKPNNAARFSGGFGQANGHSNNSVVTQTNGHNNGFTIDFQQPSPSKGMMGNPYKGYNNDFSFNLELNGTRAMSPPQQHPQSETRLQPLYPEQTNLPFASVQPPRSRVTSSAVGVINGCSSNSPTAATQSAIMNMASSGVTNSAVVGMPNALNSPRTVGHNGMINVASSGVTNSVVASMPNAFNSPRPISHNGMMNVSSSGSTNSVVGMANALNSPRAISHNGMMNIASSGMTNAVAMANALNSPRAVSQNGMMNGLSSGSVVGMANALNSTRAVNHNGIMNGASSVVTNSAKMANPSSASPRPVPNNGLMNMAGLHGVTTTVHGGSPRNHVHQDTSSKNSLDSPTLSSSPYAYNEGGQGRRSSATLDKQVERRRRRMIKNRESAARSRARKQEYITELEEEIAKLKEINKGLKEKQIELMNMQKNQEPESGKEVKRKRLRRTLTGQW